MVKKGECPETKANAAAILSVPEAANARFTIGVLAMVVACAAMLMFAENEQ